MSPPSRADTRYRIDGEQGVCGGMAALSQLTVYVVCPRVGEGHSQMLHRNYLLPIINNLEQTGDEPIKQLTPVPPADGGLLADRLTAESNRKSTRLSNKAL